MAEENNRYWIETQPNGQAPWDYVSDCDDGMVLPEMALQLIDIIRLKQVGFGRIRCLQVGAQRPGPETVLLLSNKMLDQEASKWQRKLERTRKASARG